MCCVSGWYLSLANYTFPTIFIRLNADEIQMFKSRDFESRLAESLIKKLEHAATLFPGNSFIHVDSCAPTDSVLFQKRNGAVNSGRTAWEFLTQSEKAQNAISEGRSERICLHPYRRMDCSREFRMFIKDTNLVAMSQLQLKRYYPKLHKRKDFIWKTAQNFIKSIVDFLPNQAVVIDVYLTSSDDLMIIDMNKWGEPTDPLLLRNWDQDWEEKGIGLVLAPKPVKLGGDISISF